MLASLASSLQWLAALPGLVQQSTPLEVLSILTVTNFIVLALSSARGCQCQPASCARDPVEVWFAGNASIVLWTLCGLLVGRGAQ